MIARNSRDQKYLFIKNFTLFFQVTDLPEEDLLSHFTGSNEFIQAGLAKDGAVLVHCYRGRSCLYKLVRSGEMTQQINLSQECSNNF